MSPFWPSLFLRPLVTDAKSFTGEDRMNIPARPTVGPDSALPNGPASWSKQKILARAGVVVFIPTVWPEEEPVCHLNGQWDEDLTQRDD